MAKCQFTKSFHVFLVKVFLCGSNIGVKKPKKDEADNDDMEEERGLTVTEEDADQGTDKPAQPLEGAEAGEEEEEDDEEDEEGSEDEVEKGEGEKFGDDDDEEDGPELPTGLTGIQCSKTYT